MFEVRIHGRGGQGVVTAADLLSIAAFHDGRHSQSFPSFGSERTGAPVVAFCRIDQKEIRSHDPIAHPDAVIIIDPTVLLQVDVFGGIKPDAYILINTAHTFEELGLADLRARHSPEKLCTVPATELAREHLGRPLPNVPMLGAFAGLTEQVAMESVAEAIRSKFKGKVGDGNVKAAEAAYVAASSERATAIKEATHA